MSKAETYHWCQLSNGDKHTCGYIEARGARVGAKVEMVDLDGEFWTVDSVDPEARPREFVKAQQNRTKTFRNDA